MANEYLQRTPTSTGNRRVWTWSGWLKLNSLSTSYTSIMEAFTGASDVYCTIAVNSNAIQINQDNGAGGVMTVTATPLHRDPSSWFHLLVSVDTTQTLAQNRVRIYVNGDEEVVTYSNTPSINLETHFNRTGGHRIGTRWALSGYINAEYTDVFFIDGQALTPDVFGFYKQGKGYISAGSAQATDFRPGQWVPKTPRVIKTEINRRGGFGVNGFYLPMNDSNNFGADFHGEPNSIITLNEKLPQPRVGVATTASVGLGYTDALRADPYAANLVLALPFVSGGLSSGFGDYAPSIKGSGTTKIMSSGSVSIASTASYYGTSANYQNANSYVDTPGTSGDFNMGTGDFTIEGWFYPTANSGNARLFGQNTNTYNAWDVYISGSSSSGQLWMMGSAYQLTSASIQGNQWNHVAISRKNLVWTTYINGVAAGIVTSIVNNTVGDSTNKFRVGQIGENAYGGVGYGFQGYIQDFRVYKGVAKYTGGFDVPRPYTPVGIATWRAVPDCTANNFATLNPLQKAVNSNDPGDFTDGNLTVTYDTSTNHGTTTSNVGIGTTGNWYVEARVNSITISGGFGLNIGVTGIGRTNSSGAVGFGEVGVAYENTGVKRVLTTVAGSSSTSLYGSSYTSGDIIGIGVSNGDLTFYKNGVSQGIAYTGITTFITNNLTDNLFFGCCDLTASAGGAISWNFGQNPTFSGNTTVGTFTDSNGKGLFKYQPPSGFLALCEDNLPTPAIADPGKHFKTVLYTGDGNSGRSIVGVGFTPDLVWIKNRVRASDHILQDSVRGFGPVTKLASSSTQKENDTTSGGSFGITDPQWGYLTSANYDGFSLAVSSGGGFDQANKSTGDTYTAWCWRAGAGTTSTNTDGSIQSVVSVNQDAGFSIVSYTGNGSNPTTVGHGLGKAPKFIIFKCRNTAVNWFVYHGTLGPSGAFEGLNTTSAYSASAAALFNNTAPSSTVITLGGVDGNTNGRTYIAYCWAEIEGFSKFGSYVGNASADGPFVYCGFKPAFVMVKNASSTFNWAITDSSRDPVNGCARTLIPNLSNIEDDNTPNSNMDFLSNGFKIRTAGGTWNGSSNTIIFAAFAESPFQTANSK